MLFSLDINLVSSWTAVSEQSTSQVNNAVLRRAVHRAAVSLICARTALTEYSNGSLKEQLCKLHAK